MRMLAAAALATALAGCAAAGPAVQVYAPPAGINPVLEGPIAAAPGHTLVVGDLNLAAGTPIPRHFHHGEEFLYVIGGSAIVSRVGADAVTLTAGQGLRIAPGTIHWGRAGPDGLRAVSSWVKVEGKPLREAAPE